MSLKNKIGGGNLHAIVRMMNAALLVTCIGSTLPAVSSAQVEWKDRYVSLAADDQIHQSIARPVNRDYTVIVWEDYRNGSADIYAQKIENNHGIAVWPAIDGVLICDADGDQTNPRAAYDSLGGVIITWEDARNMSGGVGMEIYAQRISYASGIIDPNWGTNFPDGVPICTGTGRDAIRPRIVGAGEGAYIAWVDYRNSNGSQNTDIYLQYILSSTATWPTGNWTTNGLKVPVDPANDNQRNHEIVIDNFWRNYGANLDCMGVVVTYEDDRNIYTPIDPGGAIGIPYRYWNVYANAFDRSGARTWPNNSDLQIDPTIHDQLTPQIVSTRLNHSGYVVTWEDKRATADANMYSMLIDRTGAQVWNPSLQVNNVYGNQTKPRTVLIEDTMNVPYVYVVVGWEDNIGANDVWANRIDVLSYSVYSAGGTQICTQNWDQFLGNVDVYRISNVDHAVVVWEDYRRYPKSDIFYQDIDVLNWQINKANDGAPATEAKLNKSNPEAGGMVMAWTDDRRDAIDFDPTADKNIYSEKIGETCDEPTELHWKDVFARWSLTTDITNYRWAIDDTSKWAFVAWDEPRTINADGDTVHAVFVQKIDRNGVPRWTNNGVRVDNANNTACKPDICYDGQGGAYVVWQQTDGAGGNPYIMYCRVRYDGTVMWGPRTPLDINSDPIAGNSHSARIAHAFYDDVNSYQKMGWIVFLNDDGGNHVRYFCRFLHSSGTMDITAQSTGSVSPQYDPILVSDRWGGVYLLTHGAGTIHVEHIGGDYNSTPYIGYHDIPAYPPDGEFGGYDIAVDPIWSRQSALDRPVYPYDALVAYSYATAPPAKSDIWAARFFNDPRMQNARDFDLYGYVQLTDNNLGGNPNQGESRYPSIDCAFQDSTGDYTGDAIVAWDNEITSNNHQVMTNSAQWDYSLGTHRFTGYRSGWGNTSNLILDEGINRITYPKIAFWDSDAGVNGLAMGQVVWVNGEISCGTAPSAVVTQLVDYERDSTNAKQWQPNQVVSPGIYADNQITPDIQSSFSYSNHAWVFWNDSRASKECITGTYTLDGGGALVLGKERRSPRSAVSMPPAGLRLDQNHPNPVSINRDQTTEIRYSLERAGYAELLVHDLLGREVLRFAAGMKAAGEHVIPVGITKFQPGAYIYTLRFEGAVQSRSMIVVR